MGGWWSSPIASPENNLAQFNAEYVETYNCRDSDDEDDRKILLVGRRGAGKSHFIECFEHAGCGVSPTKWINKFSMKYNSTMLRLCELGSIAVRSKRGLGYMGKGKDCVYFFLDATESIDDLFESKQMLLSIISNLDLLEQTPICIILNDRSLNNSSFTFCDVERVFQLHILCKTHPLLLVRLTFKTTLPIQYMFDWTLSHGTNKEARKAQGD